ncbi:hypothetical protein [Frateuria sp. Soil773]|uniref:hypothetical protein n=1 Tax=Frateuria sp. Soil773 TaxID=1736407 RepID=UPI0012F7FD5D|nr:hypothetical protein [Frateuria sp. Soil773]
MNTSTTADRSDLQNLPTQVALEAFSRLSRAQSRLAQTDSAAFRQAYEASARQVLAELKAQNGAA